MFLNDGQLLEALRGSPPLISGFPGAWDALHAESTEWGSKSSPIQACSIDLHVGEIYIPGAAQGEVGSVSKGKPSHALASGHSVVVKSLEELSLPDDIGAIALPPSHISSKGILIANFGHVDPGYKGRLRFTVINMGKEPYIFSKGEDVITLLFFRIEKARTGWATRNPSQRELTQGEVNVLSKDFADIDARVTSLVEQRLGISGYRYVLSTIVYPVLWGGAAGAAVYLLTIFLFFQDKVNSLVISTNKLETATAGYEGRLVRTERAQDSLDAIRSQERETLLKRIDELEARFKESGSTRK